MDALAPIDDQGRVSIVARAAGDLHYPARGVTERVDAATLEDGLQTMIGVPVERGHGGPVIGRVENARVDSKRGVIVTDLRITDPEARADIAAQPPRLAEASADYEIGRLDANGTQIGPFRYRALALIPPGVSRCGPTCSIERPEHRVDCTRTDAAPGAALKEIPSMKIKIAGKEYEVGSPEAEAALAGAQARLDALEADAAKLRAERSARIRQDAKRAGVTLRKDADDTSVMSEVIAKVFPSLDLSGASPEVVSGAFQAAIASLLEDDSSEDASAPAAPPPPKPGEPPTVGAAGARADALNGRARKDAQDDHVSALPPDVAARQNMIRRGQGLATAKD